MSVEAVRVSIEALGCFRGRERLDEVPENEKKWYWAIYTWFLCVSMVQAWRLYRLHKREQFMLDV